MDRNSECWYVESCEEECHNCLIYIQMKWQFDNSGLPKAKYKPIRLIATEDNMPIFTRLNEIRKGIDQFVKEGRNLYIGGLSTGTGKTSWAIKMLQTYFHYNAIGNHGRVTGMFVSTTELLLQLKDFNNPLPQEYKNNLLNADLVVWDDIAVSGMSAYDYTQLFTLIDKRILNDKSNIFTSNYVSADKFSECMGTRLASRIWDTSEKVFIKGGDWRGRVTDNFKSAGDR